MKKIFIALCVVLAFTSASCKKDCRCTATDNGKTVYNQVVGKLSTKDCKNHKVTGLPATAKVQCKSE